MKEFSTCPNCSGCSLSVGIEKPPSYSDICAFLKMSPPLISGELTGWRMRAKLAIRGSENAPLIGLFQEGTHDVVDIPNCRANHPSINEAAELLREAIKRQHVAPYNELRQSGALRYAQFFVCRESGRVQIVLVSREKRAMDALVQDLWSHSQLWHSIWINIQPHPTNQILGNEWVFCLGDKWMWQKLGRCKAAFHPAAFSQANLGLFDRILEKLEEWIPQNARLLEIYAGVGAISLHLETFWQGARLVEDNPYAQLSFQQTVASQPEKPMQYILGMQLVQPPLFKTRIALLSTHPARGLTPFF